MNIPGFRLFHLDHYLIMLDVVKGLLEGTDSILVGQGHDPVDVEPILQRTEFDILLLGLSNAVELRHQFSRQLNLLSNIRSQFPELKVIVYSMNNYADDIAESMNRGANWYLGNSIEKENLIEAIRNVKRNHRHISKQFYFLFKNAEAYFTGFSDRLIPRETIFSSREIEILRHIASGCSSKEISEVLRITPKTVESHRKNLIKKSRVKNTPELIYFSYQHGFL